MSETSLNPTMSADLLAEHAHWMRQALQLAQQAAGAGEVPVGAVVVKDGRIVGRGCNAPVSAQDPTAHAEVLALRDAAKNLGNYRLDGCTLYVTLEPCTMCAGALLHARVAQVVYGACEPKTGAAGSVLDVFAIPQINHHTHVLRGVLEQECAQQLAQFFQGRRQQHKVQALQRYPLADTALRNPDSAFAHLPHWPYETRWWTHAPVLQGLRMAYVDASSAEPEADASRLSFLCLHGAASWGYAYRHLMPQWLKGGHRVVVPDLLGFGRSDQPKREKSHQLAMHLQSLEGLVQHLNLQRVVLVGQGDGGRLAQALAPMLADRLAGLWLMDSWPAGREAPEPYQQLLQAAANKPHWDVPQAWESLGMYASEEGEGARPAQELPHGARTAAAAPFAQAGHRAGLKAWPRLMGDIAQDGAQAVHPWLERGRCWVTHSLDNQWARAHQAREMWGQVWGGTQALQQAWQATPVSPLLPAQAAHWAQQAMEYFGDSAAIHTGEPAT